ncbi:MAG: hypothetical protein NZO58_08515, partial [Gemmataceae bacterium]|nr:hypothetical protein [Gemmataceae bacterium]
MTRGTLANHEIGQAGAVPAMTQALSDVVPAGGSRCPQAGTAVVVQHRSDRTSYRVSLNGRDCFVKLFRRRGWLANFWERLTGCRARREFARAKQALARGVATAKPLGWAAAPRHHYGASVLITETIDDAIPLYDFVHDHLANLPAARHS